MEAQFGSGESHRHELSVLIFVRTLVNLGMIIEIIFSDCFDALLFWTKEGEEFLELPLHCGYLERFFRRAEFVVEELGLNMLALYEKSTEILYRVLELSMRKEAVQRQSIPTEISAK
jgi:hypothetical protein